MTWGARADAHRPDVQVLLIDYLASLDLQLAGEPVGVGAGYPESASPEDEQLPYLAVLDAGSNEWGATSELTVIQVTAWADNPGPAKNLAALARGHLIAFPGSPELGSVLPATRQAPVRDPETGHWLCATTVRVLSRISPHQE